MASSHPQDKIKGHKESGSACKRRDEEDVQKVIRLCHGPPSWITSLNIVHEVEATRGKFTNKMATSSDSVELEFWHKNITKIPKVTNSFVEDFAEKNLPIKATVTRGYKFFHEEYIHDIEGEPR